MPRSLVFLLLSGFKAAALFLLLPLSASAAFANECIILNKVVIDETRILSQSDKQALIAPFLGDCIDTSLTRELLAAISNYYIELGYVTTRPYLQEQDISDGQIELRILPGRIEAVIDAESGTSTPKIFTAFVFNNEVLNLRELETSLEVIERVDSVSANFEIRPGTQVGSSIVAIKTQESNPLSLELGINGQTDLDAQYSFRAGLDNLLNINDIAEFRYNSGDVRETYQSNRSRELNYSFPLGAYLFAFSHSDISFRQRLQGINESFLSTGDSISNKLRLSKLSARNQAHKLSLALSLELRDTENFFEDQLIDTSSYKTSQLQLELQHEWLRQWGQLTTFYTFYRGLSSFGARDDDYFTLEDGFESEARLQFKKLSILSYLTYYLNAPSWQLNFNLHLQYSDDILFASDKLNLGSPYTVRGYSSALSGSNAWYLRSDISKQFQSLVNPLSGKPFAKSIALSLGLDYGEVRCEVDNADVCGEIYGVGSGIVISDTNFNGRLLWGHPLKQIGDDIGAGDKYLLDMRWSF